MHQVLFYMGVQDWTVEFFLNKLNTISKEDIDQDVKIRISTGGGSVVAGWGLIAGLRDWIESHNGNVEVNVDGRAMSWGAMMLLFFSDVSAIEQTEFMFHRAAFSFNPDPTDEQLERLKKINNDMKKAFKQRINVEKFEALATKKLGEKVTVNSFFDSEKPRLELFFNSKEAKSIGLIKNVITLSPVEAEELNSELIAAEAKPIDFNFETEKDKNMTLEEFKEKHPGEYKKIVAQGAEQGTKSEKTRVNALLKFADIDQKRVNALIEEGKDVDAEVIAEFTATALKKGAVAKSEGGNAEEIDNEDGASEVEDEDEKKKAVAEKNATSKKEQNDFDAKVKARLGIEAEASK